ncbi:unnamed protein product [Ambrosiozyma monospora]|uniref:Unnamed protein product n=1 Tax=Ambrosiozyma monospora TaxID=43982 RepID=A0ACB5TPF2_AMBMO|nr:unnamed protein product [Ambrosiozyma monospora]
MIKSIESQLYSSDSSKILICCNNSQDLSIGMLLCCLNLYYDESWVKLKQGSKVNVSKNVIRRHLVKVIEKHKCNPSRATLNSVNSFLMS